MELPKMITQLRAEREIVEQAIITLEKLSARHGKRRGRPPKWATEAKREEAAGEQELAGARVK
jgi:hypothetical protein